MIRYAYNRQVQPPGPFVHVNLQRPVPETVMIESAALLDTGADQTVIPRAFVDQLGLLQLREIPVEGFGGGIVSAPTFLVRVAIRELPPILLEVLSGPGETYVLLGRDMLNRYPIKFDGPRLAVEIETEESA